MHMPPHHSTVSQRTPRGVRPWLQEKVKKKTSCISLVLHSLCRICPPFFLILGRALVGVSLSFIQNYACRTHPLLILPLGLRFSSREGKRTGHTHKRRSGRGEDRVAPIELKPFAAPSTGPRVALGPKPPSQCVCYACQTAFSFFFFHISLFYSANTIDKSKTFVQLARTIAITL